MRRIIPALALLLALTGPGSAGEGPGFYDRPAVGQPLRYTDARGNVFRPRSLVIVAATSTLAAPLPASTSYAASEEHLDLSASPLIGQYFRRRLAPGDAAREGTPVGRVYRLGGALVLDARQFTEPLGGRAVVLTANFPATAPSATVSVRSASRPRPHPPATVSRREPPICSTAFWSWRARAAAP
jgi:hypothetical protein